MGRLSPSHFDDLFLSKLKSVCLYTLQKLNTSDAIQGAYDLCEQNSRRDAALDRFLQQPGATIDTRPPTASSSTLPPIPTDLEPWEHRIWRRRRRREERSRARAANDESARNLNDPSRSTATTNSFLVAPPPRLLAADDSGDSSESEEEANQPLAPPLPPAPPPVFKKPDYTFEQFVDHLDPNSKFLARLCEILITQTAAEALVRKRKEEQNHPRVAGWRRSRSGGGGVGGERAGRARSSSPRMNSSDIEAEWNNLARGGAGMATDRARGRNRPEQNLNPEIPSSPDGYRVVNLSLEGGLEAWPPSSTAAAGVTSTSLLLNPSRTSVVVGSRLQRVGANGPAQAAPRARRRSFRSLAMQRRSERRDSTRQADELSLSGGRRLISANVGTDDDDETERGLGSDDFFGGDFNYSAVRVDERGNLNDQLLGREGLNSANNADSGETSRARRINLDLTLGNSSAREVGRFPELDSLATFATGSNTRQIGGTRTPSDNEGNGGDPSWLTRAIGAEGDSSSGRRLGRSLRFLSRFYGPQSTENILRHADETLARVRRVTRRNDPSLNVAGRGVRARAQHGVAGHLSDEDENGERADTLSLLPRAVGQDYFESLGTLERRVSELHDDLEATESRRVLRRSQRGIASTGSRRLAIEGYGSMTTPEAEALHLAFLNSLNAFRASIQHHFLGAFLKAYESENDLLVDEEDEGGGDDPDGEAFGVDNDDGQALGEGGTNPSSVHPPWPSTNLLDQLGVGGGPRNGISTTLTNATLTESPLMSTNLNLPLLPSLQPLNPLDRGSSWRLSALRASLARSRVRSRALDRQVRNTRLLEDEDGEEEGGEEESEGPIGGGSNGQRALGEALEPSGSGAAVQGDSSSTTFNGLLQVGATDGPRQSDSVDVPTLATAAAVARTNTDLDDQGEMGEGRLGETTQGSRRMNSLSRRNAIRVSHTPNTTSPSSNRDWSSNDRAGPALPGGLGRDVSSSGSEEVSVQRREEFTEFTLAHRRRDDSGVGRSEDVDDEEDGGGLEENAGSGESGLGRTRRRRASLGSLNDIDRRR
ncbi:hypothetical protein IE53DRAFT_384130 [Violaceomyces palustris]|uniref:Uncharacterized protein n=1 Tax=Violaceomyces palustris TaxID=1673888 RepID=A0ACD0P5G1_9BASI|nr:hypothetical protein IE53DRAFT_384130 [Violaceomyces palustris]